MSREWRLHRKAALAPDPMRHREQIRGIEWTSMIFELMCGAICGAAAVDVSSYYQLGRPVKDDEVIDFVLSHS